MSFLTPNDTNLVMDAAALPVDVLKRLADNGATGVVEFVNWYDLEPYHSLYDWRIGEEMVERCRKAGLKVLLIGPREVPPWVPDSWCCRSPYRRTYKRTDPAQSQVVWGHLSPWCEEAQALQLDAERAFCAHFNAPDVLCVWPSGRDAEALIPQHYTCIYDDSALADYRAYTGDPTAKPGLAYNDTQQWLYGSLRRYEVQHQGVYLESHPSRTIVTALHPAYEIYVTHTGFDYLHALKEELRPAQLIALIWDYYSDGKEKDWMPPAREYARRAVEDGAQVWTGSEWPNGLRVNTAHSIAAGFSGFVTAPLHPLVPHKTTIEPWEYQAFADSRAARLAAREVAYAVA